MGFSLSDFEKSDSSKKADSEEIKKKKLDLTTSHNRLIFFLFKLFASASLKLLSSNSMVDYRIVRWKIEHRVALSTIETLYAKKDLYMLKRGEAYFSDYVNKWGTSLLDNEYLEKKGSSLIVYNNIASKNLCKAKRYLIISIVLFVLGVLMVVFSLGRLSSIPAYDKTENAAFSSTGNVYVSDSPGSKRYHRDRNCQALKRSTGHITATDENDAVSQGKTLCGWCGK